jgi:transposase
MTSHASSVAGAASVGTTGRRRFTPEFKRHLVELTLPPGASVAGIALAHQLNADPLFKWRREYLRQQEARAAAPPPIWLPVEIVAERTPAVAEPPPAPRRLRSERSTLRSAVPMCG